MNTCPKNDKDKLYAKGTKYIHVENIIKYSMYFTHFRAKMMPSNQDTHQCAVAKKRVG